MGAAFGIGAAAMFGVAVMAAGNATGRIAWGHSADRLGIRRSMLAALATLAGAVLVLLACGRLHPAVFLAAACVVGFCYGSNFAIYPTAVAHLYGTHVLGTVYPLIMAAQGISSFASSLNGFLVDQTKSYVPGLVISLVVALGGLAVCWRLTAVTSDE
jgi:MFS family permease